MPDRRSIPALALTALALTAVAGASGAQAHSETPRDCHNEGKTIHCSSKMEQSRVVENGKKIVIKQTRTCYTTTDRRDTYPPSEESRSLDHIVNCSNTVSR
jgi:hypothetical protein